METLILNGMESMGEAFGILHNAANTIFSAMAKLMSQKFR